MSKKPRQPKSQPGSGRSSTAGGDESTKETTAAEASSAEALFAQDLSPEEPTEKEAAERPSLPAFGFADEVLTQRQLSTTVDAQALPEFDRSSATGPERIFSFADSVSDIYSDEEEAAPRRLGTWVTFDLAEEIFAIPVDAVREVLRVSIVTRVPHAPNPIRGVTNLRGRVIPVIDLRVRIGLPAKEIGRSSRILVVQPRGRILGLLVDAVRQVIHLDLDAIQVPPDDVMTVQSDYLTGVYQQDGGLLLLLDVERALIIKEVGAA